MFRPGEQALTIRDTRPDGGQTLRFRFGACHDSRMSSATSVFLVARRHVDFGRVRSMMCQPA
jgi:hypothetical protein